MTERPPLAARILKGFVNLWLIVFLVLFLAPLFMLADDYFQYERERRDHEAKMEKADQETERLMRELEKTIGRKL